MKTSNKESKLSLESIGSQNELNTNIVNVTPAIARMYLKTIKDRGNNISVRQRSVKERKVEKYAQQMRAGNWMVNGQPIIFSDLGYLLDGMHRCEAIILAETPIKCFVVEGVKEETMVTIDQGAPRTHADILTMAKFPKKIATILGTAGAMEMKMRALGGPYNTATQSTKRTPMDTPADVLKLAESDKRLVESVEWASSYLGKKLNTYPLTALSWLNYRFNQIDPEFTQTWLDDFITGANLSNTDTRLWIRSRISREANLVRKTRLEHRVCWLIRGWDRGRKGFQYKNESGLFSNLSPSAEFDRITLPVDHYK